MKNIKRIIIILILIIICILFFLIRAIIIERNRRNEEVLNQGETRVIDVNRDIVKINSFQVYYQINNCINKYIKYINNNNLEAIKTILLDNYIEQKYIENLNDIKDKEMFTGAKYIIKEIYSATSSYEKPYYVYGALIKNGEIKFKYFVFYLDLDNETYSLKDISEVEFNEIKQGNFEFNEKNIEKKEYNINSITYFSKEDIAKFYFYDYIENIVYNTKYAYITLDETYRQKRFGGYDNYRNYLKNNINNYKLMEHNRAKNRDDFKSDEEYNKYLEDKFYAGFKKYTINQIEDYTQYICMDFNDNYYIFNVFQDFSYSVILDTYTIDLPQFIEKYNSSSIQEKVAMNIDKFIKSLNENNYKYAYNCLAEGFKNNKFKNIETFENFMKNNIFEKNIVEYKEFKNEGETYIYNIILKNSNNDSEIKNMQIIMRLNEATDFVMSFNMK